VIERRYDEKKVPPGVEASLPTMICRADLGRVGKVDEAGVQYRGIKESHRQGPGLLRSLWPRLRP